MFPSLLVQIVGNSWSAFAIKMASSAVVCVGRWPFSELELSAPSVIQNLN